MYCVGLAVVRVVHVLCWSSCSVRVVHVLCWSSCSEGGPCTVLV